MCIFSLLFLEFSCRSRRNEMGRGIWISLGNFLSVLVSFCVFVNWEGRVYGMGMRGWRWRPGLGWEVWNRGWLCLSGGDEMRYGRWCAIPLNQQPAVCKHEIHFSISYYVSLRKFRRYLLWVVLFSEWGKSWYHYVSVQVNRGSPRVFTVHMWMA